MWMNARWNPPLSAPRPMMWRWPWPRPRRWRVVRSAGALVLGSDSLVVVEGRRFDKPTSRENAAEHLRFFSGARWNCIPPPPLPARRGVWSHAEGAPLCARTG
jgi:hypothetical protein